MAVAQAQRRVTNDPTTFEQAIEAYKGLHSEITRLIICLLWSMFQTHVLFVMVLLQQYGCFQKNMIFST